MSIRSYKIVKKFTSTCEKNHKDCEIIHKSYEQLLIWNCEKNHKDCEIIHKCNWFSLSIFVKFFTILVKKLTNVTDFHYHYLWKNSQRLWKKSQSNMNNCSYNLWNFSQGLWNFHKCNWFSLSIFVNFSQM